MKLSALKPSDQRRISKALQRFDDEREHFEYLAKNVYTLLAEHPDLRELIHSMKWRVKDREHLEHKLVRKTVKDGGTNPITSENLLDRIEDLAGVRLLHLHTTQFPKINSLLLKILRAQKWVVSEPEANIWDDEYREFYEKMGIKTISRDTMYTSVHYILRANSSSPHKCELQVRTLAEEIWGEVSHVIDYPDKTRSVACQEQLKVLARLTSGCIRLVDSVFESSFEHERLTRKRKKKKS